MSDEGTDETCDQTPRSSGQEDKAPDKPEESVLHQHGAGRGPSTKKSASATSAPSNSGNNPLVKTSDTSSSEVNHSVTSKDTSTNEDKPSTNSEDTSSDEDNPAVQSNSPSSNGDSPQVTSNITSSNADNPVNADRNTASKKGNPSVNSKNTSSNGDNPSASNNNTFSPGDSLPVSNKDTSSNDDKPSMNSEDTSTFVVKPPVNSEDTSCSNNTTSREDTPSVNSEGTSTFKVKPQVNSEDTSRSNNTTSSEDKPSVKSMGASCDKDQPVVNHADTSYNEGNLPVNVEDSKPSVNSKDSSSKQGVKSPGREKHSAHSGYFGGSMFSWLQSAGNAAIGEITEGIAAIGAKMFDEPEESKPHQDNVESSSPSAEANASESPRNAPSQNGENPSVRSKDISSQEDNPPVNRLDTSSHEDKSSGNGEGTSSNEEKPSVNIMNTSSVSDEDSNPKAKKDLLRYAAVGVAAGTAAVVAAPLVLGAAGIGGAGVAVGSIAAATVKTGGLFAMAASNAAIGGITGGIAALGAKMFDSFVDIKVLICGSGSEAHAFAAIASSMKGTDVRVFSLNQDEADYWFAATPKNDLKVTFHRKGEEPTCITSKAPLETSNPEDAMQDIDIVVLVLPAFAHQVLLYTLKPYFKPGTIIVGLPGAPGFEFHVQHVLGDVGQQCTIMNFESSPWVSCISDFSVGCEVLGTKETLLGAIKQGKGVNPKKDPVSTLQYLLGSRPKLNVSGHLLGVHLMSVNAYLHTSILYGQWEGWQGEPVDEPPLFYNGLTEPAADLLSSISDEIVNIARVIELKTEANMSHVVHIHLWFVRRYSHDISNKSTLYKAIQTNAAYQGIKHPVKTTEDGKFVPDFTHRYMTEDVPYGLVVIRGIAEIVGVETPNIDKVLSWCQEKMGKEYLVNSKLQGKDVGLSTAPQRYGLTTLESIL